MNTRLAVITLAAATLAACEPNHTLTGLTATLQAQRDANVSADLSGPGNVYTLTNQVAGNAVAVFSRGADGRLTAAGTVATGGLSTGAASWLSTTPSAGGTPFGFAFGLRNDLFVSEATGSASSYVLDASGTPALVSGAVSTHQGAPCWAVVTQDGRFGFTGNGAGSVSAFTIATDGAISLVDATGGTALIGAGINDIALSHNSRYLYVLQTGGAQAIHAFRVAADGHLTPFSPIVGVPNGTRGLAAL